MVVHAPIRICTTVHTRTHTLIYPMPFWCMDKKNTKPLVCLLVQSMIYWDLLKMPSPSPQRNDDSWEAKKNDEYTYMAQPNETFSACISTAPIEHLSSARLLFAHSFICISTYCVCVYIGHLFSPPRPPSHLYFCVCIYFVICRLFYNYCNGCWAFCKPKIRATINAI